MQGIQRQDRKRPSGKNVETADPKTAGLKTSSSCGTTTHFSRQLASQLDAGGAFKQLAVAPLGAALAKPIEQIGVDLNTGGRLVTT